MTNFNSNQIGSRYLDRLTGRNVSAGTFRIDFSTSAARTVFRGAVRRCRRFVVDDVGVAIDGSGKSVLPAAARAEAGVVRHHHLVSYSHFDRRERERERVNSISLSFLTSFSFFLYHSLCLFILFIPCVSFLRPKLVNRTSLSLFLFLQI